MASFYKTLMSQLTARARLDAREVFTIYEGACGLELIAMEILHIYVGFSSNGGWSVWKQCAYLHGDRKCKSSSEASIVYRCLNSATKESFSLESGNLDSAPFDEAGPES
jgi:hypothetical protein